MEFEWDPDTASRNLAKHGISFHEAATVFGDPLAITYFDPDHSDDEDRYLTFGYSSSGKLLVVSHTDRGEKTRIISARQATRKDGKNMSKENKSAADQDEDDLRPEYDLSQLKGPVRGKYYQRYQAGTNLALLAPDVRKAFPSDEAVNAALRSIMHTHPAT